MKKILLAISFMLMLFQQNIFAQETFKLSGQLRPRLDFDNKDFSGDTKVSTYTTLRSRLGVQFMPSKDVNGFIQIQDGRMFGTESSPTANTANVDLHQAYFEIKDFFSLPVDVKVGRMEASYGNERLFGVSDWGTTGRSLDGFLMKLKTNSFDLEFLGFQEIEKSLPDDYEDMYVLAVHGDIKFASGYKVMPFIIWQRKLPSEILDRYTLGMYVKGDVFGFTHETEFSYQLGSITPATQKMDISAFLVAFNAGYTFNEVLKPTISAGIDYLSGDDNSDDDKYKVFNTLYGTGHKYLGYMDYFTNIPKDTDEKGIMDLHLKFSMNPFENFKVAFAGHLFNAAQEMSLADGTKSKDFGFESDLTLNYKYSNNVSLQGGASLFSPGDIFKETKGEDTSSWIYLMAVVNF
ncbi:MAG: alginate export family protein [bacterium]